MNTRETEGSRSHPCAFDESESSIFKDWRSRKLQSSTSLFDKVPLIWNFFLLIYFNILNFKTEIFVNLTITRKLP